MASKKYDWQEKNPDWTDERLIDAYQKSGNASYVAELFNRYKELTYGLCIKYLKDAHESEDATYDLFETLLSKLKTNPVNHFKSWFYRVASNHCIDKIRKAKTGIIISLEDKQESIKDIFDHAESVEKEALLAKIDYCLNTLNPDQKTCIDLFYFQEKSYQDISESLNISWATTRSFIQNGKRNLKICMEKNEHRTI